MFGFGGLQCRQTEEKNTIRFIDPTCKAGIRMLHGFPKSESTYASVMLQPGNHWSGEEITITGFGKFRVRSKNVRVGRNPRTGREITIPPRRVVTFQASSLLKKYVNPGQQSTEPDMKAK
jgi:hypothetical protein